MELNEMKLGDVLKILAAIGADKIKSEKKEESGGIRIVVLQRGWVAVGRFFQKGSKCRLENAATIRIWGTSGLPGLSHLAANGPVDGKTILDKSPKPIRFHELTVVHMYDCEESKWEKHL